MLAEREKLIRRSGKLEKKYEKNATNESVPKGAENESRPIT